MRQIDTTASDDQVINAVVEHGWVTNLWKQLPRAGTGKKKTIVRQKFFDFAWRVVAEKRVRVVVVLNLCTHKNCLSMTQSRRFDPPVHVSKKNYNFLQHSHYLFIERVVENELG